ncbi:MAG: SDR family NAD(P)-dependent oxidoreductase, partial [Rhodospirillales bacterium]|nr:SDR family NAD(P)-dependent oxidoreductase [Rhodospirillales bacterium]
MDLFADYMANEGVEADNRAALLADLEHLSHAYALATLDRLGWQREAGASVDSESLRQRLKVGDEHVRLFRRLLEMQVRTGVLTEADGGFVVAVGSDDPLPDAMPDDAEAFAGRMAAQYDHGSNEIGLFRRSANALPDVLRGEADALTLLFSSGEPTAADLYLKAPVARAANRLLADAIAALLAEMPSGRRLRVIEVGAGTGSATASVLPELPEGGYDYIYTDISAGFFSEAESRFGGAEASIDYRVLDVEKDPVEQGFDAHGYDLVIASNVLHATRYLNETLAHCLAILAPSGQLVALENLRGQGWLDLTFGQLDGWWRFADDYRPHHALATPAVWRRALGDAGFDDIAILGFDETDPNANPDRGVIVAQGPAEVSEAQGVWVLAADRGGLAAELASELAAHNQTVVLAGADAPGGEPSVADGAGVSEAFVEPARRESWTSLLDDLPAEPPLAGIVHLAGLDGHGAHANTDEMAADARHAAASALALTQALAESDLAPSKGLWFVTRGAQVLERERGGELAGATLWGLGKVAAREAPQLQPRMLDLDPADAASPADLVNELLYPDAETHIAHRFGRRQGARLVRAAAVTDRLTLPEEPGWMLEPDAGGSLDAIQVVPEPQRPLEPGEVRAAIEAFGLNFRDVFIAIGLVDDFMGGEFCGRVLEVGDGVSGVSVGDRVVGMTFKNYGAETVTLERMIVPAPPGFSVTELATIPTAFVSAALSFELSGLNAGDRVLIHAGAGGVGLAAIQLAQAAGAEVFATASARKRDYLRSLGVTHVFDSRTTAFGEDILAATGGAGVDMVLNSLTGEGYIEASLSCLAQGGRFVEMGRVDILSEDEMAVARPDVAYAILMIDVLKEEEPAKAGEILRRVMARLQTGKLTPLIHARWPVAEAGRAMKCMQGARHIGKIVFTNAPLARGRLREDRSYLVTGGLGGIGIAVAGWLAERGAGAIVLNGRRSPDPEITEAIEALRRQGAAVQVELADVTDAAALDAMLARMDGDLPPLAGVIHSVGVLADATIGNQTWETFETVLWPKMLGAWHLHRATAERDLDMFVLFSSVAGVLGNPGQANHAAANAFLDQLAAHRRALGLPGQAIAWGAWSEIGEAEEQRERMTRRSASGGIEWITPQQGLRAFDRLVREDATTSVVLARDWVAFGESLESRPPLLEDVLSDGADEGDDSASAEDLLSQLQQAPAATREEVLASFLQSEIKAVLRLPTTPTPTVGFFDLGMDSLMAVELRNRLNRAFAGAYTASNTVVFDYPDIAALAAHLVGELAEVVGADAPAVRPAPATDPAPRPAVRRDDGGGADAIAIVGMACRFPGAPDLPAFWQQLEAGADAVTNERREAEPWQDFVENLPARYGVYRRAGFVDGIDEFDARFFRISPIEARLMDPQQRMLLETTWQALEDAGIDPDGLRGSRTGVYAGVASSEYRDLMRSGDYGIGYLSTAASMAVGRVAYQFGFEGPTMPVELNCASSLIAVHQGVTGLRLGEVDLALVGGANAVLSAGITREMADLQLLSPEGRCKSFDASADGFVRGEGCGMVVLKRLSEAEADGDRIWAVIRGSAFNQNGATAGATVPNGPAQERLIERALAQAGVAPAEVDYLEAHGAGSAFGDPIEVQSAAAVYGKGRDANRPLLMGSVKTNIGHLESAAGIAGLIKTVLAMKQGVIPRHLHFENPSTLVEWETLPVRVMTEAAEWPQEADRPPRAGVSAFGISGVNAHVVLEGYGPTNGASAGVDGGSSHAGATQRVAAILPEPAASLPPSDDAFSARNTRLLPLSAKSDEALRALAGRYLAWLDGQADALAAEGAASDTLLSDMTWTAAVGRSHFGHRAGVVFEDAASLRQGLAAHAHGDAGPGLGTATKVAFVYTGETDRWVSMGGALY